MVKEVKDTQGREIWSWITSILWVEVIIKLTNVC